MQTGFVRSLPTHWHARLIRWGFNFHPAYRGTGGRVEYVAPDVSHIRVRLPFNRRTRNLLGSLFGGALFGITDGPMPTMLMWALGPDFVVWDKAASIRYRKPGRTTLYADFHLPPEEVERIRCALEQSPELDCSYPVELKDRAGVVYSVVERTIYIARKQYYLNKAVRGDKS